MRTSDVEVYRYGADWVAHRPTERGHDCTDGSSPHGMAESEVGALRRLIRAEAAVAP